MKLKRHLKKLNSRHRRPLFLIRRVVGHSMMPVLPPGTLVIGRYSRRFKPGDVVILSHKGKEKIKRISEIKDNQVFVVGDHPEASTDSRHFGWVDFEHIYVKVWHPSTKTD